MSLFVGNNYIENRTGEPELIEEFNICFDGVATRVHKLREILKGSFFRMGWIVNGPVDKALLELKGCKSELEEMEIHLDSQVRHLEAEMGNLSNRIKTIDSHVDQYLNLSEAVKDSLGNIDKILNFQVINPENSQIEEESVDSDFEEVDSEPDEQPAHGMGAAAKSCTNRLQRKAEPYVDTLKHKMAECWGSFCQFADENRGYAASLAFNVVFMSAYLLRR